jgi:hypothetical protein
LLVVANESPSRDVYKYVRNKKKMYSAALFIVVGFGSLTTKTEVEPVDDDAFEATNSSALLKIRMHTHAHSSSYFWG